MKQYRIFWVSLMLLAMHPAPGSWAADNPRSDGADERTSLSCGRNSLFLFCILLGQTNLTLETLGQKGITPEGASLLELRNLASNLHVEAEIRSYRPENIGSMPLPAIVQMRNSSEDPFPPHHFYVLYKIEKGQFYAIDGTTARKKIINSTNFFRYWTGYAMTSRRGHWMLSANLWLPVAVLAGLYSVVFLAPRLRPLSTRQFLKRGLRGVAVNCATQKTLLLPLVFLALFVCSVNAFAAPGEVEPLWRPWRCPANGGINALFCYLRINGVVCDYSELQRSLAEATGKGPDTALTLAQLSAKQGLALRPVSLTMKELLSCPLPIIVHLQSESPEEGVFVLVLTVSDKWVDYLHGPSATIQKRSREEFRRGWTTVALVPARQSHKGMLFGAVGLGLGILVPLFTKLNRLRVRS